MKKAFTMLELIFVIVILGLLSGVAISKINATRDDAYNINKVSNFKTLMNDLNTYYFAKGVMEKDFSKMTNVRDGLSEDGKYFSINASDNKLCFTIALIGGVANIEEEIFIQFNDRIPNGACKKMVDVFLSYGIDLEQGVFNIGALGSGINGI